VFFFSSLFFSLSRSLVVVVEFEEIERVWRVKKSLCFFRKHFARVVCVNTAEEEEKEEKAIDQNLSHCVLGNSAAVVAPQIHL
jgi:hypothetical protein